MDVQLRRVSFWVAVLAGTIALASLAITPLRGILIPATAIVAAIAALLFLRMLFSPTYRRGIETADTAMRANKASPRRAIGMRDPEWGLFGGRTGAPALIWLRAILFLGIFPAMLLQAWIGEAIWLWVAGTFVAMELSLMHIALEHA
ncbi:hypothetical protein HZY97_19170 [Sphingomonas sp. R-74633]|uniref:hypothetical protein n=1 Tax=Sphingomonas sp. R-74633 TaxID=2751188 RepID=UPI0015D43681|nr:hypothetical protein [Sphingomonas sp. R-74633]NYT42903.1 hypothetical protein [Sphingomonas sp. R-74633]